MNKATRWGVGLRPAVVVLLAALVLTTSAVAEERILDFASNIRIQADGGMWVAETITVQAEGDQIRRGIYRDFPTTYKDRFGNNVVVDFEVISVTRDDKPEPWRTQNRSNGVRVYAGDPEVYLAAGRYSYVISYRTNRQLGFFKEHDELYWNVTGSGWAFAIDKVTATVTLPETVPAYQITMEGYTGRFGGSGRDVDTSVSAGQAVIHTTRKLERQEALTLAMTWPKGVIPEPTLARRLSWLLKDNRGLILGGIALLGAFGYLWLAWSRHGRDPVSGVVFPHYEPPEGYSPASSRYIMRMGYDNKALSAAVVNLAVKGYLTIEKVRKKYTLERANSAQPLAAGEKALFDALFSAGRQRVELDNKNHKVIGKARGAHRFALRSNYLNNYFRTNSGLLLPSLAGVAILLIIMLATSSATIVAVVLIAAAFLLHVLFAWLMKAPSRKGRELMDRLEGFKLYLEVAEKDDLNIAHPPELTPQLFEAYLPFAIALGVEQAWAEQFTQVFASLTAEQGRSYQPVWYHGNFHASKMNYFVADVGSAFNTAISSAASPPGSSSGSGGGGSVGGGGGGGGGGGW
ncbi:MAG: DUF2207 domain-containing protein [Proteobacteria bacterium]|nr:DUF2207 domain-containing protein [Pseudomonadota bacterium]